MKLSLKILFLNLIFSTLIFSNIFKTSIYPGRIFVDPEGEVETLEIVNFSKEKVTILISTDVEFKGHIKFFPKTFILLPQEKQLVRMKISSSFMDGKKENIIYVTEISPLVTFNNQRIMPRHGVTVKGL